MKVRLERQLKMFLKNKNILKYLQVVMSQSFFSAFDLSWLALFVACGPTCLYLGSARKGLNYFDVFH